MINFELFTHISVNIIVIIHLLQTRGPYHRHNQTTQEHKKWLVLAHYRIGGVCRRTTLILAKRFYSAPSIASFTHHNTGIQQWERNEGILTSKICGKQLTEKNKKVEDKSDGGAHCHTEERKLFRTRFQMLAMQLSWDRQPINFPESVFCDERFVLLFVCLVCTD